jgi:UDP-glucuronate 4-epimerase
MTDTILVTGAAGFIGSHLVDRLLADGKVVVGIDSFEDYYPRAYKDANLEGARESSRFRLIEASIGDLVAPDAGERFGVTLDELTESASLVYHLAAQPGVRGSWGTRFDVYTRNNILATQQLLESCRPRPPRKLIYSSSSSVYGNTVDLPVREDSPCRPISPYGVTKLAGEHLVRLYATDFAVPGVVVRFFTVYGPRQRPDMAFHRFIRAIMGGELLQVFGDGEQTRDFTYVDDIVRGLVLAADAPRGDTFNLGGGSRVSLLKAIETLQHEIGKPATVQSGSRQAGDVTDTWADLSKAKSVLGYNPTSSLKVGLAAECRWLSTVPFQQEGE